MRTNNDITSKRLPLTGIFIVAITVVLAVPVASWFSAPDHWATAISALKRGDNEAAISALRLHLDQKPDSTKARLRLAGLLESDSPEEALQLLHQIPKTDASYIIALRKIAVILILTERDADAEQTLLQLSTRTPKELGPQLSLAELHFRNGSFTMALPYAQRAAEIAPNRAQTFLLLAEIRDELRQHRKMIQPLQSAIELSPELYTAHLNLAFAYLMTGQVAEAAEQADWCLQRNSDDVSALHIRASVAREQGDFDMARTLLDQALQLAPRDTDCLILHADLLLYERNPEAAYQCLDVIYDERSHDVEYLAAFARAAAAAGKRQAAKNALQRITELKSNPSDGSDPPLP